MRYFLRRIVRAFRVTQIILFGRYLRSGWDGQYHHVDYRYKGTDYRVPNTYN